MQIFKSLLFLFIMSSLMMSCMKYQYATVNSSMQANENQEFFLENDSLEIRYSFYGYGGPVTISIYNKKNEPLYIDWARSALVLNDESNTYWQNKSNIAATSEGYEIKWSPVISSTSSTINGVMTAEEARGFIAPNSYKKARMEMIDPAFSKLAEPRKQHRTTFHTTEGIANGLYYEYGKENSPIRFRSYLTLSSDPSFARVSTFESEFWVAELIQTGVKPEKYLNKETDQNIFHQSKLSGFGSVVGGTGLFLLIGLLSVNGN